MAVRSDTLRKVINGVEVQPVLKDEVIVGMALRGYPYSHLYWDVLELIAALDRIYKGQPYECWLEGEEDVCT